MIKKIALLALSSIIISANSQQTTTITTVGDEVNTNKQNRYGNPIYERTVKIETNNFKVNNQWSQYRKNVDAISEYSNISRNGKFKITVGATSACTIDSTLDSSGCSGQKPFLLNNEAVKNLNIGQTISLAFQPSRDDANLNMYVNTSDNKFYPLDVPRDSRFYEDSNNGGDIGHGTKTFFSFFTKIFNFMFDTNIADKYLNKTDISDNETSLRSDEAQKRRKRYIANIIAGIEKDKRLQQGENQTAINQTINTPVSLLHYSEALKTTENEQCKLMFLNLNPDGFMCRMMSGFGMDAWMPFFNKTKTTKIETNYIMLDTENALLAMANGLNSDSVPYYQSVGGNDDNKLSFLQNILKPMTTMISVMKSIMFGESKKVDSAPNPYERVYKFDDSNATTLTFALTQNGTDVDSFENFKMLKLRSVYGDSINSCRVKKKPGILSWSRWDTTFVEDGLASEIGPDKISMDSNEWIDWCQISTGNKGMFDYLSDWESGGVFNPINWMKGIMNAMLSIIFGSYEIKDISSSISRGLILDLQKIDLSSSNPLNSRKIEIIEIK